MQTKAEARRQGRRWSFGQAVLDEDSWTLSVDGHLVAVETKPLELLHELLLHAGTVVTKEQLLDAIWPEVSVVEASLPTAVTKLRRALKDVGRDQPIIKTVSRVGYRLAVPVKVDHSSDPEPDQTDTSADVLITPRRPWIAVVSAFVVVAITILLVTAQASTPAPIPMTARNSPVTHDEAIEALRALDIPRIRGLLARGWKPQASLVKTGDAGLNVVLEVCEWNPAHDRQKLMLVVRMLIDHGAWIEDRNVFGDTPYSIAKAPRYCGPDHPATRLLHAMCYSGPKPPRDRCLASYELARRSK